MISTIPAIALAAALAAGPADAGAGEAEVRASVAQLTASWAAFDAHGVASHYTQDAIWQNPFGVRLRGPRQIESFLNRLFARPGYRAAKDEAPAEITDLRMIGPDTAVVWTIERSTGQIDDATGKPMGERISRYLEVFVKRDNHWLITDDLIMDQK
jgi:uncharacterized protein (TIGR02246 family)